ncbi:exodeoxyribonuclease VII large subunit [Salinibacillus xinjiangensis]|uniref:Exodeoxyribonuclease 7 large subunit n=1 Tax=Salinibacillus xinjiangensis TaxID=1229268 RepID=A0A6G1X6L2_9BACI|nr:exodeoxyribonuclease VII large subunit [Salinibacillus xinjiangensis]MRG86545.1 exodeoxyribonuclease VII large subunit [Salinibacillus xinjiangensis]
MKDRYLTVSALTKYIKRKMETDQNLKQVYLRGEISNFKRHSRGHMYMTLKDNQSRIQAVMFASYNRFVKFVPENGMSVLIRGEIGVYEPYGQYQLYIHDMQPDGIGSLYLAYEQLKKKLDAEGLFDPSRKKSIPSYPDHIGVITSPTGAAIRDIFSTINRRYPIVKKTLLPVLVQGDYASDSIVQAIRKANELKQFDVLIIGRGGGSIEELWGFNEEKVARAIVESSIPVISAVGHETDFTISDFVADLRAPTPTGAAELAVPSLNEVMDRISVMQARIQQAIETKAKAHKEKLQSLRQSYAFRYPVQLLRQKEQDLDRLVEQLQRVMKQYIERKQEQSIYVNKRLSQHHPQRKIEETKIEVGRLTNQLNKQMTQVIQQKQTTFQRQIEKLTLLNPLEIMQRGFAIPFDHNQTVIKTVEQVHPGDKMLVKLKDGTIDCQVWGIEEEDSK